MVVGVRGEARSTIFAWYWLSHREQGVGVLGMRYEHKFEVVGQTVFPIDMLRYDSCYPETTKDAENVVKSFNPEDRTMKSVALVCVTTNRHWRPAADRWRAAGWMVRRHARVASSTLPPTWDHPPS